MSAQRPVAFALICALLFGTLFVPPAMHAATPPALSLPLPPGETWKVIQGYNCGTHTGYDENAFDLVNTKGRTRGAPVLAAADGRYWWWGARGGTVILSHGNGFYTMYSHLQRRVPFLKGQRIERGTVLGTVGSAGTSYNNPHLHFEMFRGDGPYARNRREVPLAFIEGYAFPDHGKCNQYAGTKLTAGGPGRAAETIFPPTLLDPGAGLFQIVRWSVPTAHSGIKGYQIYFGSDPQGTGEWFVVEPEVALPALSPGYNVVRVRAIDNADNTSRWVTLLELHAP